MKRFGFYTLLTASLITGMASCKQKEDPTPNPGVTQNSVKFEFNNIVGNIALQLTDPNDAAKGTWYVNEIGDSFQVAVYKYYVSNVVLNKADGSKFVEPESYHLIDQEKEASRKFVIPNVPTGEYVSVTFLIGVDSLRNTTGAQDGALSADHGMFWTWDTGYIMAKLEGFANTSTNVDKSFYYHAGGFKGEHNVLQTVTLTFPNKAIVSGSNIPNVHVFSDVLEWFKSPMTIGFADYNSIMSGKKMKEISQNYADMFYVDHIDN